jgi:hypothetical protein
MLENSPLLLRPCTALPAETAGDAARLEPAYTIFDALTGAALGFAGWRRRGGFWPRWLARPVLAVHECDDAPLVFTVHGLWGLSGRWEVCDAEGNVLGSLCGPLIKDRFGRNIALWESLAGQGGRARDGDGRELLTLTADPEGVRVAFPPDGDGSPFLRMLLLAAALMHAPSGHALAP